jgi:hypothetical protein
MKSTQIISIWIGIIMLSGAMFGFGIVKSEQAQMKPGESSSAKSIELKTLNVSELITGDLITEVTGGTITKTKSYIDKDGPTWRCAYFITHSENPENPECIILWLMPEENFAEMRPFFEGTVKDIEGIEYQTYTAFDKDSKRYEMMALKRKKLTVEITGEKESELKKIADTVISKL